MAQWLDRSVGRMTVAPDQELLQMNQTVGKLIGTVDALAERMKSLEVAVRESAHETAQCYKETAAVIDDHEVRITRVEDIEKNAGKWGDSARGLLFAIIGGLIMTVASRLIH